MSSTLGEELYAMVKRLNASRREDMGATRQYLGRKTGVSSDATYRWTRDENKPDLPTLEKLIEIGVLEAEMDRRWVEAVLRHSHHSQREAIIGHYFPTHRSPIPNNLPRRLHIRLIGRDGEVTEIFRRLRPESHHWLVPIEGFGGVGKSALALEVGWRYIENYQLLPPERRFNAVIWISAKREVLTTRGIATSEPALTNLGDIYRAIASVIDWPAILRATAAEQPQEVARALQRTGRVLLILDNLETVDDVQVMGFLRELPPPTKALVTMKFHEDMPFPLRLRELASEAAQEMILEECQARGMTLDSIAMTRLLEYTQGIPLAIWWAIGLMAMEGFGVHDTLDRLKDRSGDLQRFIFSEALRRLKLLGSNALDVLCALTFFDLDRGATSEAIAATTCLEVETAEQALHRLLNLNLVSRQSGSRFTMLPLTRDFAQQEKTEGWETEARDRWVDFYCEYVRHFGDDDLGGEVGDGIAGYREKLQSEIDNIRLAIEWSLLSRAGKAVYLVERITTFLLDEGRWDDRLGWCQRTLEVARTSDSHAGLLVRLAWSYLLLGNYKQAQLAQEKGLEISRQHGLQKREVHLLRDSGDLACIMGNYVQAAQLLNESLQLAKSIQDELGIRMARLSHAGLVYQSGDYQKAKQELESLLSEYRDEYPRETTTLARRLALIAINEGRLAEAQKYLIEANRLNQAAYSAHDVALINECWGDLASVEGDLHRAFEMYRNTLDLATRVGMKIEADRLQKKLAGLSDKDVGL